MEPPVTMSRLSCKGPGSTLERIDARLWALEAYAGILMVQRDAQMQHPEGS